MRRAAAPGPAPAPALGPALLALLLLAFAPGGSAAQASPTLRLVGPDGDARSVEVVTHRGYHAVPASVVALVGWVPEKGDAGAWRLVHGGEPVVSLRAGSPFFRWRTELRQLADPPYELGGELHLPLQLLLDFFPARLAEVYAADGASGALRVTDPTYWTPEGAAAPPASGASGASGVSGVSDRSGAAGPARDPAPTPASRTRVVIIDPGHGGRDPGARGPGGVREKDVALALGRALARELRRYPDVEVHMTRERDVLIPLWQRGAWATERKGDRPGVFLSLHANAHPTRQSVRGFETYFLSEARNEHERRVAANENAPLAIDAEDGDGPTGDLGFILRELRNLDHAHWSALLAEMVQERMSPVHPGPNRGVKQAPLAVITNALMPAVLVEAGFITNASEARTLADPAFHRDAARALAEAVVEFFQRYPPGRGTELEGAREHR